MGTPEILIFIEKNENLYWPVKNIKSKISPQSIHVEELFRRPPGKSWCEMRHRVHINIQNFQLDEGRRELTREN